MAHRSGKEMCLNHDKFDHRLTDTFTAYSITNLGCVLIQSNVFWTCLDSVSLNVRDMHRKRTNVMIGFEKRKRHLCKILTSLLSEFDSAVACHRSAQMSILCSETYSLPDADSLLPRSSLSLRASVSVIISL